MVTETGSKTAAVRASEEEGRKVGQVECKLQRKGVVGWVRFGGDCPKRDITVDSGSWHGIRKGF